MKERHTRVSEIKPVWSGKTSLERNKLQRNEQKQTFVIKTVNKI